MNGAALRGPIAIAILAVALLVLLWSSVAIVPETKQAVILRLEQPYRTVNTWRPGEKFGQSGAGVVWRVPMIDRIVWVDKRVLDLDLDEQPVLSTDQQRVQVDAFARFRIVDPLKLIRTAGSEDLIADRIKPLFSSALRGELGKIPFAVLLSPERGEIMHRIQESLQKLTGQYGVEIVDVRIKKTELPEGSPLQSAYQRMRTARQQEAATIRAQGLRDAQIIRANAQAQAAQIYAASFGKDPEFYNFYRAMQSYKTTFLAQSDDKGSTQIILSPQDGYLREFMNGGQR